MGDMLPSELAFVIIEALVLSFSVLGNLLVILCLIRYKRMRSVTNIFVGNLALSDILLAGVVIPQKVHDISHTENFHEGQFLCKLVNFSPVLCIVSSVYSMVAVSIERYRAVVHNEQMLRKTCFATIACIWLAACVFSIPTIVEFSEHDEVGEGNETFISCGSGLVSPALSLFNGIFLSSVTYFIPLAVISTNYIGVAVFLTKLDKNATKVIQTSVVSRSRMRVVKMMIIVGALFAISWLPYFVVLLLSKITRENGSEDSAGPMALVMISLSTFSASYNVVLYAIYNHSFRRAFKSILCCKSASKVGPATRTFTQRGPTATEFVSTAP